MDSYAALDTHAQSLGLRLLGGFHPDRPDRCPPGTGTLLLIGPDAQGFWPKLRAHPAFDGPNPVDRYSQAVIADWARALGARVLFPFTTPLQPFVSWALRSGRCHLSPVNLLVHDTEGLMVSFRGALALADRISLPAPLGPPCDTCTAQPCRDACPVGALGGAGYDTKACHTHLETPDNTCMAQGCAARRACPVSHIRPDAQSAHHMGYFHR